MSAVPVSSRDPAPPCAPIARIVLPPPRDPVLRIVPVTLAALLPTCDLDALNGAFSVRPDTNGFVVSRGRQPYSSVAVVDGHRVVPVSVEITRYGSWRLRSLLVSAKWGSRWNRP